MAVFQQKKNNTKISLNYYYLNGPNFLFSSMPKSSFMNFKFLILLLIFIQISFLAVIPNDVLHTQKLNNAQNSNKKNENNTHANSSKNPQNKLYSEQNNISFNVNTLQKINKQNVLYSNSDAKQINGQISLNQNTIKSRIQQKIDSKMKSQNKKIFDNNVPLISALNRDINSKVIQYVKYIIDQNRKKITQHNKCKNLTYKLRENKFIIYSKEQFKSIFLTLEQPGTDYVKNQPTQYMVQLPQSINNTRLLQQSIIINWKTARKVTSVKYQIDCGACYSFTAIGAIESAYAIKGHFLNLAEQQIIDCSSQFGNKGCIGGWTTNAYKYIKKYGILYESDYPFTALAGNCTVPSNKTKFFIKDYVQLKNDCKVVIEGLKLQPLAIAVNALDWQYYSSGVYTDCKTGPSNHGVVLAGVDNQSWLIKNSWGYSWGEQGYIRIGRNATNNACNICSWASYPII